MIGIMESLGKEFLHPLEKVPRNWFLLLVSLFELFGLKGMTILSTIVGGMKRKCKVTFGKVFKAMLEFNRESTKEIPKGDKCKHCKVDNS